MSDGWGWWAGYDDERYTIGPEDSREAVIEAAKNEEMGFRDADEDGPDRLCFCIVEARQDPIEIAKLIDIDDWIVRWEENELEEMSDPDSSDGILSGSSVTPEQWADLQTSLRAAASEWQSRHAIRIKSYMFSASRNAEDVMIEFAQDGVSPAKASAAK